MRRGAGGRHDAQRPHCVGRELDARKGFLSAASKSSSRPALASTSNSSRVAGVNGRFFGGSLDFDEGVLVGHDDIEIDIGRRVLRIVDIEQRCPLTTPTLTAATAASSGSRLMRSCSRNLPIAWASAT